MQQDLSVVVVLRDMTIIHRASPQHIRDAQFNQVSNGNGLVTKNEQITMGITLAMRVNIEYFPCINKFFKKKMNVRLL